DGSYFGDHYKWRVMRSNGVPEDYVTGDKPAYERFLKFVESLEMCIGNPMYHWCNLELRQFFGFMKPLTLETAEECWNYVNDKLQNDPELTVRGIMKKARVYMVGTTDDPVDSLEWHKLIAADPTIDVKVCPSFRPDKAINISKPGFVEYIGKLAASVGKEKLESFQDVCAALTERLEFFASLGCRASDHGLDYIPFRECCPNCADKAFRKAMAGEELTVEEAEKYQTQVLLHLGREYHRLGIAMQIHYSCLRNMNERMYKKLGPDTGFDMIAQNTCGGDIARLLSALDLNGECPKTILYSLNPADNEQLGTLLGLFQSDEVPGKIQHGSAWWFNDTKSGMEEQMKSLANLGLLGNFVGMLTDSRSFLSYARHDYFRRIMCNLVGNWVENGEYPNHEASLKKIVEGISFYNAKRYFAL
ncbi:MAG: glucuronate isomerase, partial [bacterium]